MVSIRIEPFKDLSRDKLELILQESVQDGHRNMMRLVEDYESGSNRFDQLGETLLAAYNGEELIGVCGLNSDPGGEVDTGRIRRLYVLRSFRRRGIGRQLIDSIVLHGALHFAKLSVHAGSDAAGLFYDQLGFRKIEAHSSITHILTFPNVQTASHKLEKEPRGDAYVRLLRETFSLCDSFTLVVRDSIELEEDGERLLRALAPFQMSIRKAGDWPGTVLDEHEATLHTYECNDETLGLLLVESDGLYDWRHPRLPEDLCAFKGERVWLASVAHEKMGWVDEELARL